MCPHTWAYTIFSLLAALAIESSTSSLWGNCPPPELQLQPCACIMTVTHAARCLKLEIQPNCRIDASQPQLLEFWSLVGKKKLRIFGVAQILDYGCSASTLNLSLVMMTVRIPQLLPYHVPLLHCSRADAQFCVSYTPWTVWEWWMEMFPRAGCSSVVEHLPRTCKALV